MTNQQKYTVCVAAVFKRCLKIVDERSSKYASAEYPFENFEASASVSETTVSQGIMTRFGDKLMRLKKALTELRNTGAITEFSDESLEDTICDMINYLAILRVWTATYGGENIGFDLMARPGVVAAALLAYSLWVDAVRRGGG